MRRKSDPRRRMAVGTIDRDDTLIGIMEWELGSRVVGDMLPENEPVLREPVLKTRIALAQPKTANTKPDWYTKMMVRADSYVEMFVTLEHEDEQVYLCEDVFTDDSVPKLELVQVYPAVKDESERDWIVDIDLVEFAADKYEDVVALRKAARDSEEWDEQAECH